MCRSEWLVDRAGGDESDVTPPAAAVGGTAVDDADEWWSANLANNRLICNDMYAKGAKEFLDLKYPLSDPKSKVTAATTAAKADRAKCEVDLADRGVSAHDL